LPELPEVEVIRRNIAPQLLGRTIVRAEVLAPRQVLPSPDALLAMLPGAVVALERRGKLLLLRLENATLVFHLRMSGRLECGNMTTRDAHARVLLVLDNDTALHFIDARRFGGLHVGPPFPDYVEAVAPDPLGEDFDEARVIQRARGSRRRVKPWLLDQTVLSGVGNIYADEALHRAGLHPEARVGDLSAGELGTLVQAVQAILREAIAAGGASIDWAYEGGEMQNHLRVYGRKGSPCVGCGAVLAHKKVDKRGTTWCPACQPLPVSP